MACDEDPNWLVQVEDEIDCLICRESKKVPSANITGNNETSSDDRERQLILDEVKFIGTEIGGGAYGRVFEVEYEGTLCTAREVDSLQSISIFAQDDDKVLQDSFFSKYHTWSTLHHPCIVQFIGIYYPKMDKLPVIVMERMHSSLRGLVEEHADIPMNVTLSILSDVCHGLQYLHSREPPIVHQNLTPDNILLCYHFKAKISDVGIVNSADMQKLSQAPRMPAFVPLESSISESSNDLSLDTFSFGGVILFITTHHWPRPVPLTSFDPDTDKSIVLTELQRYQQYLDKMVKSFINLKPLVISCLSDNPEKRPSVVQVLTEIKEVKKSYSEKLCSSIWATKVTGEQQQVEEQQLQLLQSDESKQLKDTKETSQVITEAIMDLHQRIDSIKTKASSLVVSDHAEVGHSFQQVFKEIVIIVVNFVVLCETYSKQKKKLTKAEHKEILEYARSRVPIFIDQAEETLKLINQKWESIPSDDEKEELFKSLIPEVNVIWKLLARILHRGKKGYKKVEGQVVSKGVITKKIRKHLYMATHVGEMKRLQKLKKMTIRNCSLKWILRDKDEFDDLEDKEKVEKMICEWERICEEFGEAIEEFKKMIVVKNKLKWRWWKLIVSHATSYMTWLLAKLHAASDVVKPAAVDLCRYIDQKTFSDAIVSLSLLSESDLLQDSDNDDIAVVSEASTTSSSSSSWSSSSVSSLPSSSSSSAEDAASSSKAEPTYPLFVAKYDYKSRTDKDMSFNKGDKLYIINNDDKDWWFARAKSSGQEGCVLSSYVAESNSLEAEDWYFGDISRIDAEQLLKQPSIEFGSFLVRKSGKKPGEYSLSLRNMQKVNHFKINKLDESFYLEPKTTFKTISELVAHYDGESLPIANYQHIKLKSVCLLQPHAVDLSSESTEGWETSRKSIGLVRKISTGTFSEVWEGLWNRNTPVAVKLLKPGALSVKKFLKEAELLKQLIHPKLIQLCAVCTQEEPIYIIIELMKHGSLLQYLRGDGQSLKLPQLIDMGAQVAAGMAYLEEKKCIHRDLAARNVLVGENLICKVADFSSARLISKEVYKVSNNTKFPIKWTAIEAILHHYFTIKCDVWSFGIVLFELTTHGRFPYPGMNNTQVIEALQTGYRMPCPDGCSEQLYEIMKECWRDEASSRPTFKALQGRMELLKTEDTCLYSDQSQVADSTKSVKKSRKENKSKPKPKRITSVVNNKVEPKVGVTDHKQNDVSKKPHKVELLDGKDWYFGAIDRKEAEKLLMDTANASGSFLVRESKSSPGSYSLSIRDAQKVSHHKIQKLDGGGYFLLPQFTFASISELIEHYSKQPDGLLKSPCVIKTPQIAELTDCEINRKSVSLVKKIGSGKFGEVWQGKLNGSTEVAIKVLKPGTMFASDFLQEAVVMSKLRHPQLIHLHAVCTKEDPVYIITEFMKYGNLLEYLRGDGHTLRFPKLIDIGAQVADGMAYLEKNNYIHRDLAARNVLVGNDYICKVADFGLARHIDDDIYEAHAGEKFPTKWTAPEGVMYGRFTVKSDVWSFGILLYEISTHGDTPYPEMTNAQVTEKVQAGYRMPCPSGCTQQLYEIMLECWKDNAALRPTFKMLQQELQDFFKIKYRHDYRDLDFAQFDLM